MPAKVKVRILAGRNLPVMDKSSDASDAFVEVKLGNTTYKTEVYRRSLNPFWNSEWFRFEVSDQELQDEPLQIRIMDYDTYSANDAIGKVYINLNPLIVNPHRSMSGWLPIYDTLHGIRGEINCMIKVNLFADNNRYRHSSCGVKFFFSDIPNGYKCDAILGFVDELLVNDDPEYQWIDKIRTPRASNEARQTLFTKLSGEVQRKLGLKAEILGGNAVIGYQQSFDLEGGSGIVGRGIGTAVVLSRVDFTNSRVDLAPTSIQNCLSSSLIAHRHLSQSTYRRTWRQTGQHSQQRRPVLTSYVSTESYSRKRKTQHDISSHALNLADSESDYTSCDDTSLAERPLGDIAISNSSSYSNSHTLSSLQKRAASDTSEDSCEPEVTSLAATPASLFTSLDIRDSLRIFNRSMTFDSFRQSSGYRRHVQGPGGVASNVTISLFGKFDTERLAERVADGSTSARKKLTKLLFVHRRLKSANKSYQQTGLQVLESPRLSATSPSDILPGSTVLQRPKSSQLSASPATISQTSHAMASQSRLRRQEKSQTSTSIDDTLSTIMEGRLDDVNLGPSTSSLNRRPSSTSDHRSGRRSSQSHEVDFSSEAGVQSTTSSRSSSSSSSYQSSKSDDDTDSELSFSKKPTAKTPERTNDSSLAASPTSEASNSILTDDTVRQAPRQATNHSLVRSDSSQEPRPSTSPTSHQAHPITRAASTIGAGADVSSAQKAGNGGFVQSVRAVKAQQHLLQNLVRHQNEPLVAHSMARAKRAYLYPNCVHESEYPFVTMKRLPRNSIECTGGVVSVHSVKLLDHIMNDEESETRDSWWTEIRKEIRSHARALNCNTVLGYSETSKVLGDVCVLNAIGTAANLRPPGEADQGHRTVCTPAYMSAFEQSTRDMESPSKLVHLGTSASSSSPLAGPELTGQATTTTAGENLDRGNNSGQPSISMATDCSFCHTPLRCLDKAANNTRASPLPTCMICRKHVVPDVLLLTIEPPPNLNIASGGQLVQARVCRAKRDSHGEASAKEIGDALPFLEYELHRQLFSKLKFKGMNCLFNLSVDISVGENMITGLATGTGCFVFGLPVPEPPQIGAGKGIKASKLSEIQRLIAASAMRNRQTIGLDRIEEQLAAHQARQKASTIEAGDGSMSPAPPFENQDITVNESGNNQMRSRSTSASRTVSNSAKSNHHHSSKQHHHRYPSHSSGRHLSDNPLTDDANIVLEVDDNEDADIIALLIDSDTPSGYSISNSECLPLASLDNYGQEISSLNMFTQVMRIKLTSLDTFAQQFDRCMQALFVKLRRSLPCTLTNLTFFVDLPEANVLQISVTGSLLGLVPVPPSLELAEAATTSSGDGGPFMTPAHSASQSIIGETAANRRTSKSITDTTTNVTSMLPKSSSSPSGSESSSSSVKTLKSKPPTSSPTTSQASSTSSNTSSSSNSLSSSSPRMATKTSNKQHQQPHPHDHQQQRQPMNHHLSKLKSATRSLSRTNLAALLGVSGSAKMKTLSVSSNGDQVELAELANCNNDVGTDQRASLTAAVRGPELRERTSLSQPQGAPVRNPSPTSRVSATARNVRAVFKRQPTYPGAVAPAISGHDSRMSQIRAPSSTKVLQLSGPAEAKRDSSPSASGTARKLLNRVRQPLKELASSNQGNNGSPASTAIVGNPKRKSIITQQPSVSAPPPEISPFPTAFSTSLGLYPLPPTRNPLTLVGATSSSFNPKRLSAEGERSSNIDITSLSFLPGADHYNYLGNLSFSFVRETSSVRENSGLSGFIHCFLMEVYAIVRAHVSALGGNALLSLRLQQSCIFYHSNKNQAQCLISVAGDAVQAFSH